MPLLFIYNLKLTGQLLLSPSELTSRVSVSLTSSFTSISTLGMFLSPFLGGMEISVQSVGSLVSPPTTAAMPYLEFRIPCKVIKIFQQID